MNNFLDYTLFSFYEFQLKLSSLLYLSLFVILIIVFLRFLKNGIYRVRSFDDAKKYSIYTLLRYVTLVVTSVIGLQIIGINLSILMASSAALLVGLGLGVQHLFSDYISGIILLADSTIKVGDVIEVNRIVCKVVEINLRVTKVHTRDDMYIILPNTEITRNPIMNWTLNEIVSRFEVKVGVDYNSDVGLVKSLILDAAKHTIGVESKPEVFVRFSDFGESALEFTVYFFSRDVFRVENIKSNIRTKIFEKFKVNNVSIPFPQRVVHTQHILQ